MGIEDVDRTIALVKQLATGRTVVFVDHNMHVVGSLADRVTVLQADRCSRRDPTSRCALTSGSSRHTSEQPMSDNASVTTALTNSVEGQSSPRMLEVSELSAWYGEARVLTDVSIDVAPGEVVTLVGRNGAGKTTLLRSVMGLHRQTEGAITFDGADLAKRSADARARAGIAGSPTTAASTRASPSPRT